MEEVLGVEKGRCNWRRWQVVIGDGERILGGAAGSVEGGEHKGDEEAREEKEGDVG